MLSIVVLQEWCYVGAGRIANIFVRSDVRSCAGGIILMARALNKLFVFKFGAFACNVFGRQLCLLHSAVIQQLELVLRKVGP